MYLLFQQPLLRTLSAPPSRGFKFFLYINLLQIPTVSPLCTAILRHLIPFLATMFPQPPPPRSFKFLPRFNLSLLQPPKVLQFFSLSFYQIPYALQFIAIHFPFLLPSPSYPRLYDLRSISFARSNEKIEAQLQRGAIYRDQCTKQRDIARDLFLFNPPITIVNGHRNAREILPLMARI